MWFYSYVESNEQNELTSKIKTDIDGEQDDCYGPGKWVEGSSKKGNRMHKNMDNRVVITGSVCVRGINGSGKNTIKDVLTYHTQKYYEESKNKYEFEETKK